MIWLLLPRPKALYHQGFFKDLYRLNVLSLITADVYKYASSILPYSLMLSENPVMINHLLKHCIVIMLRSAQTSCSPDR